MRVAEVNAVGSIYVYHTLRSVTIGGTTIGRQADNY